MCLPATRRLRQSENPTANTPVTVTPETRAACFVSPGDAPGNGAWSGMATVPLPGPRIVSPAPGAGFMAQPLNRKPGLLFTLQSVQ